MNLNDTCDYQFHCTYKQKVDYEYCKFLLFKNNHSHSRSIIVRRDRLKVFVVVVLVPCPQTKKAVPLERRRSKVC